LLRELGAERFGGRHGRELFDPEFFERALDPRGLLELSERDPEAALAVLETIRELGGRGRWRYERNILHREVTERLLDPRRLLRLSEHNPPAALAMLRVVRELGGEEALERYGP